MRGTRIPTGKRVINNTPPVNPADYSEANADNLMFLWDNMGTGDYLQDAAIAGRHLSQLFCREQATPNMTLEVLSGVAWFAQNSYVVFAGGNSPAFVAPGANPRIDILTIRNDGTLHVIQGAEAASPSPPTIPSTDVPLAQVYNVVGETVIHDNDTQVAGQGFIQYDLRPFVQVAVGSSAMPKIGLVQRVQASDGSGSLVDVVNFTGAGRLRVIHQVQTGGAGSTGELKITIDGTVINDFTGLAGAGAVYDVRPNKSDQATALQLKATTDDPANLLDIFFKSSLRVQHKSNGGGGSVTTTVEYEHE